MSATEAHEDALARLAIKVAMLMREDLAEAHRILANMDRLTLEQLACVLAAMVDPNVSISVMAWWRILAPKESEEVYEARRRVLLGRDEAAWRGEGAA